MLRSRITPCLLIQDGGLVKTIKFKDPKYVGDPINAVRIFNEKQADELVILDINATKEKRAPNFRLIERLASECRMPLCYGGGIRTLDDAKALIGLGVEKVALGTVVLENPDLINEIVAALGNQSVVCVLNVQKKKTIFEKTYRLVKHNGFVSRNIDFKNVVKNVQERGVGEIIFNCIDRDGCMEGYDMSLVEYLKGSVNVPVTFLGGCGSYEDILQLIESWGTVGCAAGSFFVFKGKYRAVLISYPTIKERDYMLVNTGIGM